ncbi:Mdm33 family-domain-containing protein [Schizophyllum commune]
MTQEILEKPVDKEDNLRMLLDLNGGICEVVTGVVLTEDARVPHEDAAREAQSTSSDFASSSHPEPGSSHPESASNSPSDPPTPSKAEEILAQLQTRLREFAEQTAIAVRNRADDFTARSKSTFSQLGAELNRVTGYEEIDALKKDVVARETHINEARKAARDAKLAYERAVLQRSNSQREVNDLLQRKSTWTDTDVSRFTTLVREDHLFEQAELRAKAQADAAEEAVEREFTALMQAILARYHEEQVWSDKIRSASTYGQLAALALNLLVFILATIAVEPWKRRRLAATFERKVEELSREMERTVATGIAGVSEKMEVQNVAARETIAVLLKQIELEREARERERSRTVTQAASELLVGKDEKAYELTTVAATTAVVAGLLGWLLRSSLT